jgi:hypothetical protein
VRSRLASARTLALLGLAALAGCSSGQHESASAELPAQPPISVRGDDGRVIGTLASRDHPPQLIFVAPDGQRVTLGECADEVRQEALGGGGRTARVEVRNCGATVDFATRVLVYGAEGDMLAAVFAGQPDTRLHWTGADTLAVHCEPLDDARVYARRQQVGSVSVRYIADRRPTLATPDDALDGASMNFGATARAGGLSLELLQRIAGWSQQASGLYRPAWGSWAADAPFGDDPRGHAQVLAGVAYYADKYGGQGQTAP